MSIYLDNAATTAPYPEVIAAMQPYLSEIYGNPSSTHSIGRKARTAIEQARKTIAGLVGASASEIIFTAGGTEAANIFLQGIARHVPHIISSPLEHPAVLATLRYLEKAKITPVTWLKPAGNGQLAPEHLRETLAQHPNALVALMHGNNEIGNLLPLPEVAAICQAYDAPFFTDAVQTTGRYTLNVNNSNLTGLAASAHKFHGPKGVGFLYLKKGTKLTCIYHGGEQERGLRMGTENVAAIAGMAKALELSYARLAASRQHIERLKSTLTNLLREKVPGVQFNGTSGKQNEGLYTILSASFPPHPENDMLIFKLDLAGIAVSAGSACASGANKPSHVLQALQHDEARATVRFSFAASNTVAEMHVVADKLAEIYG